MAKKWFTYAIRDLNAAKGLRSLGSDQKNSVAFHCQQCVEKAIKGYLVTQNIRPPKSHSIVDLAKLVEPLDSKLAAKLKKAKKFTKYAVVFRYPDAEKKPLTMREVDSALTVAQKIFDLLIATVEGE